MRPFGGHSLQEKNVLPDGAECFFSLLIAQKANMRSRIQMKFQKYIVPIV